MNIRIIYETRNVDGTPVKNRKKKKNTKTKNTKNDFLFFFFSRSFESGETTTSPLGNLGFSVGNLYYCFRFLLFFLKKIFFSKKITIIILIATRTSVVHGAFESKYYNYIGNTNVNTGFVRGSRL